MRMGLFAMSLLSMVYLCSKLCWCTELVHGLSQKWIRQQIHVTFLKRENADFALGTSARVNSLDFRVQRTFLLLGKNVAAVDFSFIREERGDPRV